jgi:hypothetical protein
MMPCEMLVGEARRLPQRRDGEKLHYTWEKHSNLLSPIEGYEEKSFVKIAPSI